MSSIRPRVRVPRSARAGEEVEIRTLISHPMETGNRIGPNNVPVPRHTIELFTCHFNGTLVMEMQIDGGISADPYFEFFARVDASGRFEFAWHDSTGEIHRETAEITVN